MLGVGFWLGDELPFSPVSYFFFCCLLVGVNNQLRGQPGTANYFKFYFSPEPPVCCVRGGLTLFWFLSSSISTSVLGYGEVWSLSRYSFLPLQPLIKGESMTQSQQTFHMARKAAVPLPLFFLSTCGRLVRSPSIFVSL